MKLYEVTNALAKLEDMQEEEELKEYLDSVNLQVKDKINQTIKFERNLKATADAIDGEIKRLQELKYSYKTKAQNIKDYISYCMKKNGIEKVETEIAKLSFRKSESVDITDKNLIPKDYLVEKVTIAPDKTAIKKAIKEGKTIDGAVLKENQNLQIK